MKCKLNPAISSFPKRIIAEIGKLLLVIIAVAVILILAAVVILILDNILYSLGYVLHNYIGVIVDIPAESPFDYYTTVGALGVVGTILFILLGVLVNLLIPVIKGLPSLMRKIIICEDNK